MVTFHHDVIPSSPSTFAHAVPHCASLLRGPPLRDVADALVAFCTPNAESTSCTDVHDPPSPHCFAISSSDGDWIDVASDGGVPTFSLAQLTTAFIWLYHLITALVIQVAFIASDVATLKDRVTEVEARQTRGSDNDQEIEAAARRTNALREHLEDRIASLERSQCEVAELNKRSIQELTDKNRNDDEKLSQMVEMLQLTVKDRSDTYESLSQTAKMLQLSMECEEARIMEMEADNARKISLLRSDLELVQVGLAMVRTRALAMNVESASREGVDS